MRIVDPCGLRRSTPEFGQFILDVRVKEICRARSRDTSYTKMELLVEEVEELGLIETEHAGLARAPNIFREDVLQVAE